MSQPEIPFLERDSVRSRKSVRFQTAPAVHRSGAVSIISSTLALVSAACWLPDRPATSSGPSSAVIDDPSTPTAEQWMPIVPRRTTVTEPGSANHGSTLGAANGDSAGTQGPETDDDAGVPGASDGGTDAAGAAAPNSDETTDDATGAAGATATDAATQAEPEADCSRESLLQQRDAYLEALSTGTPETLPLDPSVYYTENGEPETVGRGLWWSQPTVLFARHALDPDTCGSLTEAVLEDRRGNPIVLGLRLRHASGHIVDIETVLSRDTNRGLFEPEKIIVIGRPDPWLEPIPLDAHMSREALVGTVEDFFDSIVEPSLIPPRAPTCEIRQNGASIGGDNCTPGTAAERFEQLRYSVVDVTTGLVGGVGIGHGYLATFLFKIDQGTLVNVDFAGGTASNTTGW